MTKLDAWAHLVKSETDRHLYQFRQTPSEYNNSAGYFRILMLITILQQHLSVHYNPDRIRDVDFGNSKDLFIHGMVGDENGGTCVSMPVLYTAVARRLGYPVKLVLTKAHVFCRWDAPDDRFNIEATNRGLNTHPDSYYRQWPHPVSDAELKAFRYFVSLSPAEELACFLSSRGHCLLDNGRPKEAAATYAAASRLAPHDPAYRGWVTLLGRARNRDGVEFIHGTPVLDARSYFDVEKFNAAVQASERDQQAHLWPGGAPHDTAAPKASQGQPNFGQVPDASRFSLGRAQNSWHPPKPGWQPEQSTPFHNHSWQRDKP